MQQNKFQLNHVYILWNNDSVHFCVLVDEMLDQINVFSFHNYMYLSVSSISLWKIPISSTPEIHLGQDFKNCIIFHEIRWYIIMFNSLCAKFLRDVDMGQVTELWLSCYLVLLSIDNKIR